MFSVIQPYLSNPVFILVVASVIGLFVGKYMHDLVLSHQRHLRLLLTLSVINISILVLFWCLEIAFQKSNWIAGIITWAPQQIYLGVSMILLVAALFQKSKNALMINIVSVLFVAVVLMGFQFTAHKPAVGKHGSSDSPVRVMQFDIDNWKNGVSPVLQTIKEQHPAVFCLENSGSEANIHYKQLVKALPGFHFINESSITIGSSFPITMRDTVSISHNAETSPVVIARIYTQSDSVDIMAINFMPCRLNNNAGNMPSYMPMYIEDRTQQSDALLKYLKRSHKPAVICCNLNAPPQTFAYKDIAAIYKDAFYIAGMGYGYTYPSGFPNSRLDYILVSDDLTVRSIWSPITKASLHCPVVADFSFNE